MKTQRRTTSSRAAVLRRTSRHRILAGWMKPGPDQSRNKHTLRKFLYDKTRTFIHFGHLHFVERQPPRKRTQRTRRPRPRRVLSTVPGRSRGNAALERRSEHRTRREAQRQPELVAKAARSRSSVGNAADVALYTASHS